MKSFGIPELIHEYAVEHSDGDPVAQDLAVTTQERFPDRAGMNIGHDQGRFMQMLVEMTRIEFYRLFRQLNSLHSISVFTVRTCGENPGQHIM